MVTFELRTKWQNNKRSHEIWRYRIPGKGKSKYKGHEAE
jgi:hypothetical protein